MTISWIPPAFIFLVGALMVPLLKGRARQALMLLVPVIGFLNLLYMSHGSAYGLEFLGYKMVLGRVDSLSMVFGYVFVIMAFAGMLFALHLKEVGQHVAAFFYVSGALGVVYAGDYLTLFIFWEIMAVASMYLIWARRTPKSRSAGLRYIMVHMAGGMALLAGIVIHVGSGGSLEFIRLGLHGLASWLILIGFGINAAVPPFSAWLSDAYPEATVTGTVFLSAYTSKTAVYVLARAFPGETVLLWAGAIMTLYGILFAILENDMRRILAYSIINQVGFMIAGIGIGTAMALDGTVSHAFSHIIYKALLMMSAGAVLEMTGRSKCTELGGLYRTMPLTMMFCLVGAASISAFPLTSGFISKSMVIAAAGLGHMKAIWVILEVASAGVFLHAGIKFPWFVFFAKDSGLRPEEPRWNMLLAMGFLSFLCIFIGVYPDVLYRILPYKVDFVPYTAAHVVSQLQILLFSALAFFVLLRFLQRTNTISLDTDWFYRKGAKVFMQFVDGPLARWREAFGKVVFDVLPQSMSWFSRNPMAAMKMGLDYAQAGISGQEARAEIRERLRKERAVYPGDIIKHWPVGTTVVWVTICLLIFLLIYYL